MEYLDIVDENNILTGEIEEYKAVHEKGLWHREVAVWIMNEQGEVLMQKRAATKRLYPTKWALCAGHVDSGEDMEAGAKREVLEEIGLACDELEFLFIVEQTGERNNRFSYMYFHKTKAKIEDFKIQYEELSEVKYISLQELERIVREQDEDYVFSKREYLPNLIEELKKRINPIQNKEMSR
ncbi:MAG: NUDIX domain-containing protein [Oscillospiraceae bacterium]|nr:NUDIX domain-containing protein [Oscillospiraceae bacterium]